jgi:hypothetical protein
MKTILFIVLILIFPAQIFAWSDDCKNQFKQQKELLQKQTELLEQIDHERRRDNILKQSQKRPEKINDMWEKSREDLQQRRIERKNWYD